MDLKERYTPYLRPIRDRTRQLLQTHDWTKGAYLRDEYGYDLVPYTNWDEFPTQACAMCLKGAAIVACNEANLDPWCMLTLFDQVWCQANGMAYNEHQVDIWNDRKTTRFEDVIESLDKMEPYL